MCHRSTPLATVVRRIVSNNVHRLYVVRLRSLSRSFCARGVWTAMTRVVLYFCLQLCELCVRACGRLRPQVSEEDKKPLGVVTATDVMRVLVGNNGGAAAAAEGAAAAAPGSAGKSKAAKKH